MTRLVRTFLITGSLATTCVPAVAGELTGRVLDATQAAVAGARLTLVERAAARQWIASSARNGEFRFPDLHAGAYLLKTELTGFRTAVADIVMDDTPRSVDVHLEVAGVSDEIVVTATATPLPSSEVARASTVVEAQELERRNVPLLGEALRGLPGLRVQQFGSPGSYTTVRFRGMREADTALLIDGHQIQDAGGFRGDITSFFQQVALTDLDRIEVVPGASSHLYGSSATAGVINLVPRGGTSLPRGEAQFEGGALGLVRESAQTQGQLGSRLQFSGGVQRLDVTKGLDDHGVFRNTTLNGLARYDVTRSIRLSVIANFSDTPRADLNDSPFPIGPVGNELGFERGAGPVAGFVTDLDDPDAWRESRLSTAVVSWSHRLADYWSYSVSYQRTATRRNFPDGPQLNPRLAALGVAEFPADLSLIDGEHQAIQTRHDVSLGTRHFVTVGAEYNREARGQQFVSQATGTNTGPTTDRQANRAFFLHDQLSLLDHRLNLTTSFRGQFFTVVNPDGVAELRGLDTPDAYTGGVAVAYLFRDSGTKVRAQAANGFRAPSLSERFAIFNSSVGLLRVGNPLLRPERTLTVDGGIDQRLLGDRLSASATYFDNHLQEVITSRRRLFQQVNEKGGQTRGIEVALRAAPWAGVEVGGGYTFTHAKVVPTSDMLRSDSTIAPAGVSRSIESTPAHEWHVRGSFERAQWAIQTEYTGTSGYEEVLFSPRSFRPVLFGFAGYSRVDGILAYRLNAGALASVDLYVRGQNVLDDDYVEDGFRTPGASVWAGIRYRFR